jgi:transcriptional regulator with XRE-family HTH domain
MDRKTMKPDDLACFQDDTIGGRISLARDALDLPIDTLARNLGVQSQTWADWENDRANPQASRLAMIAGTLDVSLSWLLTGRGLGPRWVQ